MPRALAPAVALLLLALAALAPAARADHAGGGGRPLATALTGAAEVPGPGDPDGSGTARLRLNPGQEEVCFELTVSNITLPTTGAHIHRGTAVESGPVVVGLVPPDETGASSGCVFAPRELLLDIVHNPQNYYVNVHTVPLYAAGAVRGQLG
jgi:hypothetical protein